MQKTSYQKEQRGKRFTENPASRLLKNAFHPALMKMAGSAVPFSVCVDRDYQPIPGRPIIFAANHYCGNDIVMACKAIRGRITVVAGKQPLTAADEFFFKVNGTIFCDRKDKNDTAACKRAMEAVLKKGQDIIIFPEGTSNVSDNLLMYPMKWGTIEVAQKAHAQIIPMVLDYDRAAKVCHITFCNPMLADNLTLAEGIERLRDTMATVRWDYFAQKGTYTRRDMDIEAHRQRNRELLLSYKLLDFDYEQSVIFRPVPTPEEVFAPIDALANVF